MSSRRVLRRILADPTRRKELLIRAGLFLQHLEGIESTYEDMERAYERCHARPARVKGRFRSPCGRP